MTVPDDTHCERVGSVVVSDAGRPTITSALGDPIGGGATTLSGMSGHG